MTHISEIPVGTLVKQAHAGVKLINDQYPEAAAILREAITRFDVLREVHQLAKQEAQPVIPEGLIKAINRLLDNDGSRGRFSAIQSYDAREDLERLLASTAQPVSDPYKLPDGYALVPVEPTAGMINVGISEAMKLSANVRMVYQAMLAAAPAQESENG